ncbi:MAG: tetratricopeptide repeat protein, partial [Candidatus Omnitrophica bacterium]|nr:tetratricopeptide repeat protein [Candidatus Omnitrophota bacterium]
ILFLISNFIWSETGFEILEKAKALYEKTTKTQRPEEIEKYKEVTKLLKEAIEKTENQEIKKQIYPLLIETLDLSAEYREKHEKLKEYACLLYPEEKEKQATYLKQYADQLKEKGEIPEAIILYRKVAKDYLKIKEAKESYFQLGKIFRNEMDIKNMTECYDFLIKKYEDIIIDKEWVEIISDFRFFKKYDRAIELSKIVLDKYPNSPFTEDVLFILGILYKENKDLVKAKEIWKIYLEKYPESIRSLTIKKFLQSGQ